MDHWDILTGKGHSEGCQENGEMRWQRLHEVQHRQVRNSAGREQAHATGQTEDWPASMPLCRKESRGPEGWQGDH